MTDKLTMIVPGKPEYVGTVRMAAAHAASRVDLDIEQIDDIKVAVSEACTNIVLHAHEEPDFTYEVVIEISETLFTVTVTDEGKGFGMEDYTEPVPGEMSGVGMGMGIFIIKALMDDVEITSEPGVGTKIKMAKHILIPEA